MIACIMSMITLIVSHMIAWHCEHQHNLPLVDTKLSKDLLYNHKRGTRQSSRVSHCCFPSFCFVGQCQLAQAIPQRRQGHRFYGMANAMEILLLSLCATQRRCGKASQGADYIPI